MKKIRILIWAGIVTVILFAASPLILKLLDKFNEVKSGTITRVWLVPAHREVRPKSPGVWETVWFDTLYYMEVQKPYSNRKKTIEIYPVAYEVYKDRIGEFTMIGDSAEFIRYRIKKEKEIKEWNDGQEREKIDFEKRIWK